MPALRVATAVGSRCVAYQKEVDGAVSRLLLTDQQYADFRSSTAIPGIDISRCWALREILWDTGSGYLDVGDVAQWDWGISVVVASEVRQKTRAQLSLRSGQYTGTLPNITMTRVVDHPVLGVVTIVAGVLTVERVASDLSAPAKTVLD